jgi:hypothetical protein
MDKKAMALTAIAVLAIVAVVFLLRPQPIFNPHGPKPPGYGDKYPGIISLTCNADAECGFARIDACSNCDPGPAANMKTVSKAKEFWGNAIIECPAVACTMRDVSQFRPVCYQGECKTYDPVNEVIDPFGVRMSLRENSQTPT